MSRATQALHAAAEKWLPKNGQQQLYWVLLVSFALLLGIQTSRWLQREREEAPAPVAAATTDTSASSTATDATVTVDETAAPDAQGDVIVVDAVTVAVDDAADDSEAANQDAEQAVTKSDQPRSIEQQAISSADQGPNPDVVARVFAALGGAGQPSVTGAAAQPVNGPADLPDFFAALARYTTPSPDTPTERQSRLRGIRYLFTLHAPPTSNGAAGFFARQLGQEQHEPSSQGTVQAAVTSEPQAPVLSTTLEEPNNSAPDPVAIAEADAQQADSAAATSSPPADLASPADTAAAPAESPLELPTAELVLVNPVENGGTILYLVEGRAFSLAPGQTHRLPADRPWRVAFHRGDEFGDTEILLTAGEFKFAVGPQGWQLAPAASAP